MRKRTITLACGVALLSAAPVLAQDTGREQAEAAREVEQEAVDAELEMREAEARLAEAARRVAELSTRRLPAMNGGFWSTEMSGKPVLGITIGAPAGSGPVAGIEVLGVSPGGAAAEAGLRAGDVISAVNDESLSAESSEIAHRTLSDFMAGVEEGDVVAVSYLRAGRSATVDVAPRAMSGTMFAFGGPGTDFRFALPPAAPDAPKAEINRYVFVTDGSGWHDLEMVKLTQELGRYFGTEEGLLIVRAPEDETFQLKDGDVLLSIDGRVPASVSHAIRILGSYQQGERLTLRIMRDKRPQTLEIEMPDRRRGSLHDGGGPRIESRIEIAPQVEIGRIRERT